MRLPIRGDDNWSAFEGYDNILMGIYKGRGEEKKKPTSSFFVPSHCVSFSSSEGKKGKILKLSSSAISIS